MAVLFTLRPPLPKRMLWCASHIRASGLDSFYHPESLPVDGLAPNTVPPWDSPSGNESCSHPHLTPPQPSEPPWRDWQELLPFAWQFNFSLCLFLLSSPPLFPKAFPNKLLHLNPSPCASQGTRTILPLDSYMRTEIYTDYVLTQCTINCQMTVVDHVNLGKEKIIRLSGED